MSNSERLAHFTEAIECLDYALSYVNLATTELTGLYFDLTETHDQLKSDVDTLREWVEDEKAKHVNETSTNG